MDEAVLRIVLQDDGGGSPSAAPSTHTSQAPPSAPPRQPTLTPPPRPAGWPKGTDAWAQPPTPVQTALPVPSKTAPIPVDVVKPPKPEPPPAAAPTPAQSIDWMKSLINPAEGANPHVLLEGQSGSGKSLAAKHLAFERMRQGQEVNVVDTHTPESWGGAKQVFQGATAGTDAAKFLKEALESRKEQATESKLKGEVPDFKPMTVVFSDFARLMKDTPQLGVEFATLLTEARKFRISIIADTTALTGAASGIKGIQDVLQNFGQKVKFYAPTAQGDARKAEVAGVKYDTPKLPDYKERTDYGLVKPAKPPEEPPLMLEAAFDPAEQARKRREAEARRAQVDAAYKQQYGDGEEHESKFSAILKTADALRGTIGGVFGTLVGAVVDAVSAVSKAQVETASAKRGSGLMAGGIPMVTAPTALSVPTGQIPTTPPPTAAIAPTRPGMPVPAPGGGTGAPGAAGGGMVGMVASAAPPIAIAAAILAADQAVKGAIKGVIGGVGSAAQAIASPDDASGSIDKVSSAISSFGDKIPIIGTALVAVGETGKVLAGLMQSFTKQAEKAAEYNPQVAQAMAMAEIRQVMGDMRRSQRSGGELARFVEEQSRMQQQFEEIKMKIWMKILPVITAIMQIMGRLLNVLEDQDTEDLETPTDVLLRGGVQVPAL